MTTRSGRSVREAMLWTVAAIAVGAIAPERRAIAHAIGLSSGEYRLDGQVLYGELGMSNRELTRLLPAIDLDHDGTIVADELAAGRAAVATAIAAGITVTADGRRCSSVLDRTFVLEADGGAAFQVRFTCPDIPRRLQLAVPMVDALAPGHRHIARIFISGKPRTAVLDRGHPTWTIEGAAPTGSGVATAWSMLKLGIEHILSGADHLVFLLGLILVGGTLRALVGVITAFTLAHSLTLALATLSVFAPSPRLVEPAIALSIAYVGFENLFVRDASKRWRITFPFGLIHGFGFAGALREIALPRAEVPIALVSFNMGVELGQLAVLAVALPVTSALRRAAWFGDRGVRLTSLAIALAGSALFIVRVVPGR